MARLYSDGRRIAYTSPVGDVGRQVYEIPALGGLPRRITDGWATDWSIDGRSLLVLRHTTSQKAGGAFLVSLSDGSERRLTTFASGHIQDSARFSADGDDVLYTEVESANRSRVMRLTVPGKWPDTAGANRWTPSSRHSNASSWWT